MSSSPWATFNTRRTPNVSDSPAAAKPYRPPTSRPRMSCWVRIISNPKNIYPMVLYSQAVDHARTCHLCVIPAEAGIQRFVRNFSNNPFPQVLPIRILFLDQLQLPRPVPLLHLFFPCYRGHHIVV